jgi:transcription elongation GreA/GreB family factor
MIDKAKVLAAFVRLHAEKVTDLEQALHGTQRDVVSAPGSSESHSDTMKFQHSNLALGIQGRFLEAQQTAAIFSFLTPEAKSIASEGALVSVQDMKSNKDFHYLIVPKGGGDVVELDGQEIMAISVEAPIAKALIGKGQGEVAIFRDKSFKVTSIQ